MPIEAIDAGERCVRAGRDIRAGRIRQVVFDYSARIRDVNRVLVAGKRNSIWIKERAVELQRGKFPGGCIEAKYRIAKAMRRENLNGSKYHEIVESMTRLAR